MPQPLEKENPWKEVICESVELVFLLIQLCRRENSGHRGLGFQSQRRRAEFKSVEFDDSRRIKASGDA